MLQFYEILFSHVFFSCEKVVIIYDYRAHPQNLFKWKEFFFCEIHFKWKMSSNTNEPTPRGDFRIFICISNEKYVSSHFIHNSL